MQFCTYEIRIGLIVLRYSSDSIHYICFDTEISFQEKVIECLIEGFLMNIFQIRTCTEQDVTVTTHIEINCIEILMEVRTIRSNVSRIITVPDYETIRLQISRRDDISAVVQSVIPEIVFYPATVKRLNKTGIIGHYIIIKIVDIIINRGEIFIINNEDTLFLFKWNPLFDNKGKFFWFGSSILRIENPYLKGIFTRLNICQNCSGIYLVISGYSQPFRSVIIDIEVFGFELRIVP